MSTVIAAAYGSGTARLLQLQLLKVQTHREYLNIDVSCCNRKGFWSLGYMYY
jgi:hypothetical protein